LALAGISDADQQDVMGSVEVLGYDFDPGNLAGMSIATESFASLTTWHPGQLLEIFRLACEGGPHSLSPSQ
jgi:hypothetical protein